MAQAVWRKFRGAWLPAKTNRAAEIAVPHPLGVTRQTRNRATVRQNKSPPLSLTIDLLSKEANRVLLDSQRVVRLRPVDGDCPATSPASSASDVTGQYFASGQTNSICVGIVQYFEPPNV